MTQFALPTIDPLTASGTDLANWLNSWAPALETSHAGTARPAYAQPGMLWINTATPTAWGVSVYDGTNDSVLFSIDSTTGNASLANLFGDLVFAGESQRIMGDLSNATISNRLLFQTTTPGGATILGALPAAGGNSSALQLFNNSDGANSSFASIAIGATGLDIGSRNIGTGTALPMTFTTGGAVSLTLGVGGNLSFNRASQRLLADFTNTTMSQRLCFETSVVNGITLLPLIPNGTGNVAGILTSGNSDIDNATIGLFYSNANSTIIECNHTGTGAFGNFGIYTGGDIRLLIDKNGTTTIVGGQFVIGTAFDSGGAGVVHNVQSSTDGGGNVYFGRQVWSRTGSSSGSAQAIQLFLYGATNCGGIWQTTTTVSYNTTSDPRLKTIKDRNIDWLAMIAAVPAYGGIFDAAPQRDEVFLLSTDVEKVLPSLVMGKAGAVKDNGDIDPQQMNYPGLTVPLWGAMRQLLARVQQLESKVHS